MDQLKTDSAQSSALKQAKPRLLVRKSLRSDRKAYELRSTVHYRMQPRDFDQFKLSATS